MDIEELSLNGAKLITPKIYEDERGFFIEAFHEKRYQSLESPFVQDNHSYSKQGVIRGMHFQSEPGQAKLVRAAVGKIYDVIVDIRSDSPTFGKWLGVFLDDQSHQQLFIPSGFAHGFCTLTPEAHVLYKVSSPFCAETERGFRYDDPEVAIKWPVEDPIVSERDQNSPYFYEMRWS
ncbi:MAG: dTDP-4-dehydrorhamnose 3,5-epimerase [Chlamydiae bacterium]|nr:dTDP-4-dehydrorhamnose 3,5-epimerase [Chlamydiota bacterium]